MPSPNNPQQFAERLETLFEQKGLKAEYVVSKVGISRAYLSRLRHGKATNPSFTVIQALAEVFGVSPAYFFGEEKDEPLELEELLLQLRQLDEKSRKALMNTINAILEYL